MILACGDSGWVLRRNIGLASYFLLVCVVHEPLELHRILNIVILQSATELSICTCILSILTR